MLWYIFGSVYEMNKQAYLICTVNAWHKLIRMTEYIHICMTMFFFNFFEYVLWIKLIVAVLPKTQMKILDKFKRIQHDISIHNLSQVLTVLSSCSNLTSDGWWNFVFEPAVQSKYSIFYTTVRRRSNTHKKTKVDRL